MGYRNHRPDNALSRTASSRTARPPLVHAGRLTVHQRATADMTRQG
jgi:hypothetical protein